MPSVSPLDKNRLAPDRGTDHLLHDPVDIFGMDRASEVEARQRVPLDTPEVAEQAVEIDAVALRIAHPDHDRRILGQAAEAFFRLEQALDRHLTRLLAAVPLNAEGELAGDHDGELPLRL